MKSGIENWHDCISDILSMRSRDEWKNKFQENKEQIIGVFTKLHDLSEEDIFEKIAKYDEYMESQLAGIYIETFLSRYFEDGSNVVDAYIKRFRHRLPKDKIKIYEEFRNAYFSVYKVVDVKENEYSIIKDVLFDTNEIKVIEHSGSKREMIGHYILSDILEFDGKYFFSGVIFSLDENIIEKMTFEIKKEIKKLKLSYKGKNLASIDEVRILLYHYYPVLFYYALAPYIIQPKIVNPNGDELEPKICKFKIHNKTEDEKTICDILTSLHDLREYQIYLEDDNKWSLNMLNNKAKHVKKANLTVEDYLLYGEISIEGDYLKVTVLYPNAINKILTIIKKKLGDLVGMAVIEDNPVDDISVNKNNKVESDDIPIEIKVELLKKFFDKHLKQTLKTKIPILNNLTPKQSLKKEPEIFYKWLDNFVDNIKTQTEGLYNYQWFLDELGVKETK